MKPKQYARVFLCVLFLFSWMDATQLRAQILYGSAINSGDQATVFYIDMATCESCFITQTSPNFGIADIVFLNDGSTLNISPTTISLIPPPPAVNITWQTSNPQEYTAGQLAPNGLVYLVGENGLAQYNPANNAITFLGPWPAAVVPVYDIFYIDGILYANGTDGVGSILIEINVSNPALSILLPTALLYTDGEGGNWNGVEGLFFADASHTIYFFDPNDESIQTICDIDTDYSIISLTTLPAPLPGYPCIPSCVSDAGVLPQTGPFDVCTNNTFNFSPTTQTTLDANDILQYVLFSDLTDTIGSIIATSDTPQFDFLPTMQTGVTYYVAAVVGNALGSNVDLNDPCVDFSNAIEITWLPLPSVQLSLTTTEICAGNVIPVSFEFMGTPPFTVVGQLLSGSTVVSTFNINSQNFTTTELIFVPSGTPIGTITVQTTLLTDGGCTCQ